MSEHQQLLINHESSGFSENNVRPTSNYGLVFEYEEEGIKVGKRHEEKLDSILYEIGFGKFQYLMLLLCGFGWLADNVSIIMSFYTYCFILIVKISYGYR
jgi:hypothetical protein